MRSCCFESSWRFKDEKCRMLLEQFVPHGQPIGLQLRAYADVGVALLGGETAVASMLGVVVAFAGVERDGT